MTPIPDWVTQYIGTPFVDKGRTRDGVDCWGMCRLVLTEQFGIELPDYANAYSDAHDHESVAVAVQAGLRDGWTEIDRDREAPRCGDLLVIKIAMRPWHCGLMVTPERFLHCPTQQERGTGREIGSSCVERLDNVMFRNRIEGIYRHASLRNAEAA